MKILYGVVGEGMGHALRSRVVLEHILSQNHDIEVMASSRACDYLTKHFGADEVKRIHGLHMIFEENRVKLGKTLWSNVLAGVSGVPQNIEAYFNLIREFKPDVVISDFESWTYLFGRTHGRKVISIDNMQIINRCEHGDDIIGSNEADFQITRAFVKGKLPFCDHYMITTFFRPKVRKHDTSLYPPILRPEILCAQRTRGEHLLVYQSGEGYQSLADTLAKTGIECRIYGMRRGIKEEQIEGNLRYRPFSESTFVEDLASSRAVIAGGGFTLMGEAVYLHKPMLGVPIGHQFEQLLNVRYLQKEGYGMACDSLDDAAKVFEFMKKLPAFEDKLAGYQQDGNKALFDGLDGLLDRAAAGVL